MLIVVGRSSLLLVRHWWWRPFISAAEGVDLLRPRTVSHGNLLHDCPWGSLISTVLRFDSPRPVRSLLLLWLRSVLLVPIPTTTRRRRSAGSQLKRGRTARRRLGGWIELFLHWITAAKTAMVIIGAGTIDFAVFFFAAVVAKASNYLYLTLDCHHWWVG